MAQEKQKAVSVIISKKTAPEFVAEAKARGTNPNRLANALFRRFLKQQVKKREEQAANAMPTQTAQNA